jgi:hypothetical protein
LTVAAALLEWKVESVSAVTAVLDVQVTKFVAVMNWICVEGYQIQKKKEIERNEMTKDRKAMKAVMKGAEKDLIVKKKMILMNNEQRSVTTAATTTITITLHITKMMIETAESTTTEIGSKAGMRNLIEEMRERGEMREEIMNILNAMIAEKAMVIMAKGMTKEVLREGMTEIDETTEIDEKTEIDAKTEIEETTEEMIISTEMKALEKIAGIIFLKTLTLRVLLLLDQINDHPLRLTEI